MNCPVCLQHAREAGAYRWAVEQARQFLPHEFNCQGAGGPNALLGCLTCVLDRLALRVSPEVTLAAARQPWLERALALLVAEGITEIAFINGRREVLDGVARVERLLAARQAVTAKKAEKEHAGHQRRAERIRTELETAESPKKEAAVSDNGRKKGARSKKGEGASKQPVMRPGLRPQDAAKPNLG